MKHIPQYDHKTNSWKNLCGSTDPSKRPKFMDTRVECNDCLGLAAESRAQEQERQAKKDEAMERRRAFERRYGKGADDAKPHAVEE